MSLGAVLASHQGQFFEAYWQKKPLLIRQAFPGGLQHVSPDELAGLSCQEGVESRLVLEQGDSPWQTRQGPFVEADFQALPSTHWTLLVQAVDRLLPEVSALRQNFRFLPNWRVDDVMISFAADQGSVGPHTDSYDVFLIQAQGRRRWDIGAEPMEIIEYRADLDLKILRHFQPDLSFELEPGDMLYLPPRLAHHGVALGSCMTYSVGFRAPSQREMLLSYTQFLLQELDNEEELNYADPDLRPRAEPGALQSQEIASLWDLMQGAWQRPELFKRWIGAFLTEPRSFHASADALIDSATVPRLLDKQEAWRRVEGARFCYHHETGAPLHFYAEGECLVLPQQLLDFVQLLCRDEVYLTSELHIWAGVDGFAELVQHLWNQGYLREAEAD